MLSALSAKRIKRTLMSFARFRNVWIMYFSLKFLGEFLLIVFSVRGSLLLITQLSFMLQFFILFQNILESQMEKNSVCLL